MRALKSGLVAMLALSALNGCSGPSGRAMAADAGHWTFLGERTVHGRWDRDVIPVTQREGRFDELKMVVRGSALELYDVDVTFGDGERFSPATRLLFEKGSNSRSIELPGRDRVIQKVEFRYGNLPRGGKARVKLFAR